MTATKKTKNSIDAPTKKIFLVDPVDLVLIGHDTKDGPDHPLYDPRVRLAPDDKFILDIMYRGVKQAVHVRKNGKFLEVVEGRQRVRAAREANNILLKQGKEPVRIKAEIEKGSDGDLYGVMISLNEHRKDDNPIVKAEKLRKYMDMGYTEDDAAVAFGVTTRSIKNWKKLLDLDPVVKKAVETEQISASAAAALADLSRDEQKTQLKTLLSQAATTGRRPTQRTTERSSGNVTAKTKAPGKKVIKNLLQLSTDVLYNAGIDDHAIKVLRWAIGELPASGVTGLSNLLKMKPEAPEKAKKPKAKAKKVKAKAKKPKTKKAKKAKAKKPKTKKPKAKKPKDTRKKKRQAPKKKR